MIRYEFLVSKGDELVIVDLGDPATFREAMNGPDSETWLGAITQSWDLTF